MGKKTPTKNHVISSFLTLFFGPYWKVFAFGFFRTDLTLSSLGLHETLNQILSRTAFVLV